MRPSALSLTLFLALAPARAHPAPARDQRERAAPEARQFPARKAVWGIDVSRYQGDIRWDLMKDAGLSFVYMKATEGTRIVDPTFLENWQGASRIGLVKGAYHFYDFCAPAAPQAGEFIKVVPRSPGALPPAIDLEPTKRCPRLPAKKAFLKDLRLFTRKLRARYGKTPVLYMGHDVYDRYFKGGQDGYPIWISDYRGRPALSDRRPWTFWQCSCQASIRGIKGPVDLDLYAGSAAQFGFLGRPVKDLPASRPAKPAGKGRARR